MAEDYFSSMLSMLEPNPEYKIANVTLEEQQNYQTAFKEMLPVIKRLNEKRKTKTTTLKTTLPSIHLDLETNDIILKNFSHTAMYYFGYFKHKAEQANKNKS